MDYEHTAGRAADGLLSYRDDPSGWQVCKKSVRFGFICSMLKDHPNKMHPHSECI